MDNLQLQIEKKQRFQFLERFYEKQDENSTLCLICYSIVRNLGFDDIIEHLGDEKLVKRFTYEGGVSIEYLSMLEVEKSLEKPTEHFRLRVTDTQ